ncbi:MAG: hypothetical protein ABI675_00925 [Chitinophagaceae bacterium]
MEPDEFRELNVELPRQRVVNQKPWWIAGVLLVFIFLLIAACSYYAYKKRLVLPGEQRKISVER